MNLPSVTQILQPYQDFSKVSPDTLLYASERGRKVHGVCGAIALNLPFLDDMPGDHQGYIESFKKWFHSQVREVIGVEIEVTSRHGYTGHIDLIVRLKNNSICIIDMKTPLAGSLTWKAQIAAYKRAYCGFHGSADCAGTLQLSPHGKTPKMTWLDEKEENQAFLAFLGALNAQLYFYRKES